MPPFDERLYRWERKFFAEQFLEKRSAPAAAAGGCIQRDLARAGRKLLKTPRVLIHRDLQSSNIILKGGRPFFIDFQGMRFGAAAYDLASLLCDPYVSLPSRCKRSCSILRKPQRGPGRNHGNFLVGGDRTAGPGPRRVRAPRRDPRHAVVQPAHRARQRR